MVHDLRKPLPVKQYDVVMCLGVLVHIDGDRRKVLENLLAVTKQEGVLMVWVYGDYNQRWLIKMVKAIKVVTTRLPVALNRVLAHPLTFALIAASKLFNYPYMKQIRHFGYSHVYEIVFDQIFPKTAVYSTEDDVKDLIRGLPLYYWKDVNQAGWLITNKGK